MARRGQGRASLDDNLLRDLLGCRPFPEPLWQAMMSPDCHTRVGAGPAAVGRERSLDLLSRLYSLTFGLDPGYWESCAHNDAIYVECEFRTSGSRLHASAVPCVWILRPSGPPIADIRVYADFRAVWA